MNQSVNNQGPESKYTRLYLIALGQFVGLSLLLAFTFMADQRNSQNNIQKLAEATARTYAQKDSSYRDLFIASGGAYITLSQEILPEKALAYRADRDIETPHGNTVTLVTPKNLLQLANDRQPDFNGLKVDSTIKTFQPLSEEDTPDKWERKALQSLRQGKSDVSEIVIVEGKEVLRFMYPLLATKGCLKNRMLQDLKVGDMLGGFSVTVPMEFFDDLRLEHNRDALLLHIILWVLGSLGISWSFRKTQQRDVKIFAAKAAQQKAYEELAKTFDAIDEIITIQDKDMRITRVNRATCEAFNAKAEDLVGKFCYEVFRGAQNPCAGCPEVESVKDGSLHNAEIEHKNLGKIFSVAAAPITGDNGETIRLVHFAKDITEGRRQEKQLRQAQKMEAIGTLAGGIAHDFNNILTAIIGFAELALMQPALNADIQKDLEQIHKAGMRAKDLVNQILTFRG